MKKSIKSAVYGIAAAIGMKLGCKLWDEYIEDKVNDFKDYLNNKRKEKGA